MLGEAERRFGPTHALYRQRQVHAEALGLAELADEAGRAAESHPPRQAWEHLARGGTLLRSEGGLREAEGAFGEARRLDPSGLWPNYYCGVCAYRLERYDDAVTAFSVCIGAAPEAAEVYANRALALAALGKTEALGDHAQAERLDREKAGSRPPSTTTSPSAG